MTDLSHFPILVAIETDATRFHGEHASRPRLPGKGDAGQILAHLSADLAALFPDIAGCWLTMPGGLYDQTQLLRPGYPILRALETLQRQKAEPGGQPGLLSIGCHEGSMPVPELDPLPDIPLGLLLLLPVLVSGEPGLAADLSERMEHRFLEAGQLSAHSAMGLEANFGVSVTHARFMTLTDLHTMLRMQLEHFGFLALWELLDAAFEERTEPLTVAGRGGQQYRWRDGAVHCAFETFDYWAGHGAGRDQPGTDLVLAKEYAEWTREYRQYLTTLQAHAVPVRQHLPGSEDEPLETSFLVEDAGPAPRRHSVQLTEHSSGDLGTVAVTVVHEGEQYNYYPLTPPGLNDLHASIRAEGLGSGGVAFPGGINYDARMRRLVPETLPAGHE